MSAGLPPMPGMAPIINVPAPEVIPAASAPFTPPPVGVAPVGVAPVGVAPVGVAPVGVAPVGVAPVGVAPVGVAPVTPPPVTQEFIPAATAAAVAQPQIEAAQVVAPQTAPPMQAPAMSAPPVTIPQAVSTAMTAAPSTGLTLGPDGFPQGGTLTEIFASIGFEGISTDGFGIMPIITLTQGEFQKDKQVIDQEFYTRILSSRPKYLYSFGDFGDKSNSGLFYTYDKVHNANDDNSTLEDFYQLAQTNGKQVTVTEYYEIDAIMLENNEAVKLSVPKRGSGSAFVKFLTQCTANRRRPQDAVVKVKRGDKVTSGKQAFYPWAFEIAGWN